MKEINLNFVETSTGTGEAIFAANDSMELEIGHDVYEEVAVRLTEELDGGYFFSGSIDVDREDFYSTLTATVIAYRTDEIIPEGKYSRLEDIVPVWWEFSTVTTERGEILNDFSFKKLKEVLLRNR